VRIKLLGGLCVVALAAVGAGCSKSDDPKTATTNPTDANVASANTSPVNPTLNASPTGTDPTQNVAVQPNPAVAGPDNSEVQTIMDENGVVIETRTFKNNKNITKVVSTTRDGTNRTVTVYNAKGESRNLPKDKIDNAMKETGDALAAAAGWTVDKSRDAASATKEGAEVVVDKTKEGAKTVADKTVQGARKAGSKTVEGAKKGANAVKDAVTP
jgi:histone H3/H4